MHVACISTSAIVLVKYMASVVLYHASSIECTTTSDATQKKTAAQAVILQDTCCRQHKSFRRICQAKHSHDPYRSSAQKRRMSRKMHRLLSYSSKCSKAIAKSSVVANATSSLSIQAHCQINCQPCSEAVALKRMAMQARCENQTTAMLCSKVTEKL